MADEVSTGVRSIVERVLEADVRDQIARRGRELAVAVTDATDAVSARAATAWQDSAPQRKEAEKAMRQASKEAVGWSRQTWKKQLRPTLKDLWSKRNLAVGATAAAIPAGREMVEETAQRLGIRRRRSRHWGSFLLGLLLGAAAGAVVAMLTTPKPGREMRDELAGKARDAADKARDAADKAREGAGEWVPLFQREPGLEAGNGGSLEGGAREPIPGETEPSPEGEELR